MNDNSHWIFKNLVWGVIFVLGLVFVVSTALKICTKHGQELIVPDFTNLTFEEAEELASRSGVTVYVSDSVYIRKLRKGAVCNQSPKSGEKVKEGRRIMLTTNSRTPKKMPMPSLVGLSLSEARTELEARGLVLERLVYVDDIATNIVIKQQYRGRDIRAGEMVYGGSSINLVLGLSTSDPDTYVPNLIGRKYISAQKLIQESSLNIGKLSFDRSVRTYNDTINAVVFKQSPSADGVGVRKGTSVSATLTVNPDKMKH